MSLTSYISARDLATRWDYSCDTVREWCQKGLIPGACKVGAGGRHEWRIPLAWIADGEGKQLSILRKEIQHDIKIRTRIRADALEDRRIMACAKADELRKIRKGRD